MRPSPHDLQGHVRETLPRAPDDSAESLLIDDTVAMRRQDVRDQEDLLLPRLPEAVDMSRQRCPEAPESEQSTDPQKSPSPEPTVRSEPETVEEAEANGPPTSPDPIWTLRGVCPSMVERVHEVALATNTMGGLRPIGLRRSDKAGRSLGVATRSVCIRGRNHGRTAFSLSRTRVPMSPRTRMLGV